MGYEDRVEESMRLAIDLVQKVMDETPDEDEDVLSVAKATLSPEMVDEMFNYLWKVHVAAVRV